MLRVLLKKQSLEMFSRSFQRNNSKKKMSKAYIIFISILFAYVFIALGTMFFFMAAMFCEPLCEAGLSWLYFALMGIMSITLGVVGSVFTTYSTIYQAKDNELLLSMPIKPSNILFVRMLIVYFTGFVFQAIVSIPTSIAYFMVEKITVAALMFQGLILFLLPLLSMVISCILGWIIALISPRMKYKNFITVILSLGFIVGYYYVYMKMYTYLQLILINSVAIGSKIKTFLYPLYQMGLGATGQLIPMIIFAVFILAVFGLIYKLLSASFLKLATMNKGIVKNKYKEKSMRQGSVKSALLGKEYKHFLGSSAYMLNGGLGTVFLIVVAILAVWKKDMLVLLIGSEGLNLTSLAPLIICAVIIIIESMNVITAPSISLEGNSLWIVKSLPISLWQVLEAKLRIHMQLTLIPALVGTLTLIIILKVPVFQAIIMLLCISFATFCMAAFGLLINLKLPNLNWTNEATVIKQGMSVLIAMLVPWGIIMLLIGLFFVTKNVIMADVFLGLVTVLFGILSGLLFYLLKTNGVKKLSLL